MVCSNATTLWHFDASEWAPSTASQADIVQLARGPGLETAVDLSPEQGEVDGFGQQPGRAALATHNHDVIFSPRLTDPDGAVRP